MYIINKKYTLLNGYKLYYHNFIYRTLDMEIFHVRVNKVVVKRSAVGTITYNKIYEVVQM